MAGWVRRSSGVMVGSPPRPSPQTASRTVSPCGIQASRNSLQAAAQGLDARCARRCPRRRRRSAGSAPPPRRCRASAGRRPRSLSSWPTVEPWVHLTSSAKISSCGLVLTSASSESSRLRLVCLASVFCARGWTWMRPLKTPRAVLVEDRPCTARGWRSAAGRGRRACGCRRAGGPHQVQAVERHLAPSPPSTASTSCRAIAARRARRSGVETVALRPAATWSRPRWKASRASRWTL